MKKIIWSLLVLTGFGSSSYAQQDAKAKAILAEVSKKYRSFDVVKADFTFSLDNPQAKLKESQQGTIIVKAKTNKYRVTMTKQELISDGKTQWTYLKEDKEVQVTDADHSGDALNPAQLFTIYEKGFKYGYTGESKVGGKVYQMIDLAPIDVSKSYFKIRLGIDKVAKQIGTVVIFDKGGNKYGYNVSKMVTNLKVPESTFSFDPKKYPGVEVVDLR
ncbi:gliding motility protein [Pedobacter sp. PACM 27299]|uniref:LolA family protein n=1 Tax=Pedobacter sp. PACM 27299 TaxID=1727164 RepID=UPI000706B496|nr:outer membrane lipoprotein carrier protein LolA [Pedobacter sp. PACM 27299]ALL05080.1 gliding motility protein [Pedobacter sp. PACM 27299]